MTPGEVEGLSWMVVPGTPATFTSPLRRLVRRSAAPLQWALARVLCRSPSDQRVLLGATQGWTYAFGYQLGLGAWARASSLRSGAALSFELDPQRDIAIASIYRDGALVRSVSQIQGVRETMGEPLPGEPSLEGKLDGEAMLALGRAWGADAAHLEWGSVGVLAAPMLSRRGWTLAVGAAVVAAIWGTLAALPPRIDRCRADCRRTWRERPSHGDAAAAALERFSSDQQLEFCLSQCPPTHR